MSDRVNAPQPPIVPDAAAIAAYLDYEMEALAARRNALVSALGADAEAGLHSDDDLAAVAENMKMAAALGRVCEDRRSEQKAPFRRGGEAVDAWFKRFVGPLQPVMARVQTQMNRYGADKLIAERARAEAERKAAQDEADRLAAEAARAVETRAPDTAAALEVAFVAASSVPTEQRAADLTRVRGMFGAVASVRESWTWEIVDEDRIPRAYLKVNDDAIKRAAKERDASGRPTRVIPGLRWIASAKVGVR